MTWNQFYNSEPPLAFLDLLANDEDQKEDVESELGTDEEPEFQGADELMVEDEEEGYMEACLKVTLEDIEVFPLSSTNMYPPSPSVNSDDNSDDVERIIFYEGMSAGRGLEAAGASNGRGRGQPGTRGARGRGGNRGSGRHTGDDTDEESDWRRDEVIMEVYVNDEDVPPALREMVYELERRRRERRKLAAKGCVRTYDEDDADDEYYDAESFIAQKLFEDEALEFRWCPMASFSGQGEEFTPQPGPNVTVSGAYEAFRTFWDDSILNHIVTETNRYAVGLRASSERFDRDWYDTNVHEILVLFAFWIMLGIIRMPSIKSCFSTNALLKTAVFRLMMTEARYLNLIRAIHFVDNTTRKPDSSELFCLGPITEHLNNKFKESYTPKRNIAIGEALTICKGNLASRHRKASQFAIKTFQLCESASGYLWSFIVDTGRHRAARSRIIKSAEVVIDLIGPLLQKGYRLFTDSWFNSPLLARFLKRNRTDCVGALRANQQNVPALIQCAKVPFGSFIARHSGDVVVMSYQEENTVHTISTCHGTEYVPVETPGMPAQYKPAVIADYNRFMAGKPLKEQPLEPYLHEHNNKWYKELFKVLLNASIANSEILVDQSTPSEIKSQAFRLELVDSILRAHLHLAPHKIVQGPKSKKTLPVERFSEVHFIVRTGIAAGRPKTVGEAQKCVGRASCLWCLLRLRKHRRTVYRCEQCDVPLCLENCFKFYHTVP